MGANDDREKLEVAAALVTDLDAQIVELTSEVQGQWQWGEVMKDERDAARAAIERVLNLTGDIGPEARRILTKSPADALAEHDGEVARRALHAFANNLTGNYTLNHESPQALLDQIVSLARRDGDLAVQS